MFKANNNDSRKTPSNLRLRILGNYEIEGRSQNLVEIDPEIIVL